MWQTSFPMVTLGDVQTRDPDIVLWSGVGHVAPVEQPEAVWFGFLFWEKAHDSVRQHMPALRRQRI